jgi:hypothetical protein
MAAGVCDLEIDQGADFEVTFTYCDPTETPIDVTGWTALLQLRTSPGSVVLLSLTDSAGITVGTTDGTFAVAMTADQTAALDQDCCYDLLVTDTGGTKTRLVEGSVSVDLAISVPS